MARLLVVEDDPDILDLVVKRLQRARHAVVAAGNAEAALEVVREKGAPEVAILDVGLPGMDGMQLLQRLRDLVGNDQLPAVFLSARVQEEEIARGRRMGAIYLTKPFVASALLSTVERLIGSVQDGVGSTW
ncbi:MAG: response regulator [Actinomycetota bacterium]|nr:response regulator [Actinomycetota bacterium]